MDGQVSPASDRGPTDPPPGQEMAEGRRTRGWSVVGNEKGDSARLGDFTAALQRLLTLRLRPLGTALADASSYGRGHRGSMRPPVLYPKVEDDMVLGFQHRAEAERFLQD